MDCEKFDSITMELLYGELDELSEAAAHRHLHQCTRCRDIWGHLRTTREIAEIPLEEPPGDLFESVLAAEAKAQKTLSARERLSRGISVLAEYAMRPQLAMAALLLLMIGSSLVFVRTDPAGHGQVTVTELGTPDSEPGRAKSKAHEAQVFDGERLGSDTNGTETNNRKRLAMMKEALPAAAAEKGEASLAHRGSYSEAMAAFQEGSYAEAERLFSEVAASGDERAASAALHEGHAARNGSGCQRAAALYDSVAERYAGGTVADEAAWNAATCYRAMGQLKRASAHYARLKDRPAYASRADKALEEISLQLAVASQSAPAETATSATAATGKKTAAKPLPAAPTADAKPSVPAKAAPPMPQSSKPSGPSDPPTGDQSGNSKSKVAQ